MIRRALLAEDGVSLVELGIAGMIFMMLLTVLYAGANVVQRTEVFTDDASRSLGELRVASERLTKELRQARQVYAPSSASQIWFWVDRDRDSQEDPSERITWSTVAVGNSAELRRKTDADVAAAIITRDLVPGDIFQYSPAPPTTRLVTVNLTTDARPSGNAGSRNVRTEIRLRNVA